MSTPSSPDSRTVRRSSLRSPNPEPRRVGTDATSSSLDSDLELASRYTILIHGFKGPQSAFKTEFDQWRKNFNSNASTGPVDGRTKAKSFQFDVDALVKSPAGLDQEVDRIYRKLERIDVLPPTYRPGSRGADDRSGPATGPENRPTQDHQSPRSSRSYVLVAHGLGAWIVRRLITAHQTSTVVLRTIGLVFLDAPSPESPDSPPAQSALAKYIAIFTTRFKFGPNNFSTPENLIDQLMAVDADFLGAIGNPAPDTQPQLEVSEPLYIWLASTWRDDEPPKTVHESTHRMIDHRRIWAGLKGHIPASKKHNVESFEKLNVIIKDIHSRSRFRGGRNDEIREDHAPASTTKAVRFDSVTATSNVSALHTPTPSRPPSRSFIVGRDGDELVISNKDKVGRAKNLANESLYHGHFQDAKEMLTEAEILLRDGPDSGTSDAGDETSSDLAEIPIQTSRDLAEILLSKFVITVQLGDYKELEVTGIQHKLKNHLQIHTRTFKSERSVAEWFGTFNVVAERWFGFADVRLGKYDDAVRCLESLVDNRNSESHSVEGEELIRILRDLSLAYAYQGDYKKSEECLQGARRHLVHQVKQHSASTLAPQSGDARSSSRPSLVSQGQNERTSTPIGSFGRIADSKSSKDAPIAPPSTGDERLGDALPTTYVGHRHPPVPPEPDADDYEEMLNSAESSLKSVRDSLFFTDATIDFIKGNYKEALSKATRAEHGMIRHLGSRHLKSLESTRLKALLLALNGRSMEAEEACRGALRRSEAEFGNDHAQTLESLGVLVFIFRVQFQLIEAMYIGKNLCQSLPNCLPQGHPRTMEAKVELAASYRLNGDFSLAERELMGVIEISRETYGLEHASTLRYLSEIASLYNSACYYDSAERLGAFVLQRQRDAYSLRPGTGKAISLDYDNALQNETVIQKVLDDIKYESQIEGIIQSLMTMVAERIDPGTVVEMKHFPEFEQVLKELNSILEKAGMPSCASPDFQQIMTDIQAGIESSHDWAKETALEGFYARFSRLLVHPYLLETLETIAAVKAKKPNPENALSEKISTGILKWKTTCLGKTDPSTLASQVTLALAKRQIGDLDRLHEARVLFKEAQYEMERTLMNGHPLLLLVERDLLITSCALEMEEADRPSQVEVSQPTTDDEEEALGSWRKPTADDWEGSLDPLRKNTGDDASLASTTAQTELWRRIESKSKRILLHLQDSLGRRHPFCLQTMIWVFVVQLSSDSSPGSDACATAEDIVKLFQHENVMTERALAVSIMASKIHQLFVDFDRSDLAEEIVGPIVKTTPEREMQLRDLLLRVENLTRRLLGPV